MQEAVYTSDVITLLVMKRWNKVESLIVMWDVLWDDTTSNNKQSKSKQFLSLLSPSNDEGQEKPFM